MFDTHSHDYFLLMLKMLSGLRFHKSDNLTSFLFPLLLLQSGMFLHTPTRGEFLLNFGSFNALKQGLVAKGGQIN